MSDAETSNYKVTLGEELEGWGDAAPEEVYLVRIDELRIA